MPFGIGRLGPVEFGVIVLIILMVFGVGKLPQVAASLGKAIRAFKVGASGAGEVEQTSKNARRAERKSATKVTI